MPGNSNVPESISDVLSRMLSLPDKDNEPSNEKGNPEIVEKPQDIENNSSISIKHKIDSKFDLSSFYDEENVSKKDSDPEIDPSSFDLNFAEFPIAHLSNRLPQGIDKTQIRYSDYIKNSDGKLIKRDWVISSNAKIDIKDENGNYLGEELIGIGGPSSLQVFYEIIQIWREQGFNSNKIYIGTYYNLLKRLGWSLSGQSYKQLERDLKSLYDLKFDAINSYYDKQQKKLVDRGMKLFEGWELYKVSEKQDYKTDYGYIVATTVFWESMRSKTSFYIPFDKDFFYKLSAHESKLALYLSKMFNPYRRDNKYKYYCNIYDLCAILPIYGSNKNKQKYYLLKAAKGLISKSFILLEDYYIEDDTIIFINKQQQSLLPYLRQKEGQKSKQQIELLVEDQMKVCGDSHSIKFYEIIAKYVPDEIIFKCLAEAKAEGRNIRKYYTFQIKAQAQEYLSPILKKD